MPMEAGGRSDIAVKLYGDDSNVLRQKVDQIAAVVQKIPGAADVTGGTCSRPSVPQDSCSTRCGRTT